MDYTVKIIGYCYHSVVNVITIGLAQSDHIKRLLLYLEICTLFIKLSKKIDFKRQKFKKRYFFCLLYIIVRLCQQRWWYKNAA